MIYLQYYQKLIIFYQIETLEFISNLNDMNQFRPTPDFDPDHMDGITVLLIFLFAVLLSIYLISMLFIMIRKVKSIMKTKIKTYYLTVCFYIVTKMVLCTVILVYVLKDTPNQWTDIDGNHIQLIFKNGLVLADLSIVQLFLIAMQHYLKLCFSAFQKSENDKVQKILLIGLKAFQVLAFLVFLIPLIIFDFNQFNYQTLNGISTGFNCLTVLLFLVTFFYLNFKMTGLMIQAALNETIKRIYKVLCIVLISRMVMTTVQIIISIQIIDGNFESFIKIIQDSQGQLVTFGVCFVLTVVGILLTQGLPMMYSLKVAVVKAFQHTQVQDDQPINRQSILTSNSSVFLKEQLLRDQLQFDEPFQADENVQLSMKTFQNTYDLKNEQSSIWSIKKGHIGKQQFIIRQAKHQISSYILQDIQTQLTKWNQLKLKSINIMTFFTEKQIVHLVQKHQPQNLDGLVDKTKNEKQFYEMGYKLALAIQQLHEHQIVHGCLKPSYILFDKKKNILLTGLGLHSFKKYLSLITGYTNKSIYTSVELLGDRNNVILKPKKQADIYSFGMIFYQIVTKNRQYRSQSLKQVQTKFCQQNFRPKLPQSINQSVKSLIRKCWQQDPLNRPQIQEVISILKSILDQI